MRVLVPLEASRGFSSDLEAGELHARNRRRAKRQE
jgi:hypothetical protein